MRQRLSSEPDRYRGRRRVPTPPRSRYAAVVTTAFVGAGFVALGAAALPDAKTVDPSALADLDRASTAQDLAQRAEDANRASRDDRSASSTDQAAPEAWVLPIQGEYQFTSPYGIRWGQLHAGVDLAAPEGTPYRAVYDGTVKLAQYYGGYGYAVIVDHGNGVETIYGHSSKLMVQAGQKVKAGDTLGLVGNTGHSYGNHLHLEVHVNGEPRDPIPWFRDRQADIKLQVDSVYSGVTAP
ncbi:M23 family metallopeptidase [Actinomycetes bacterium KLBMP 9797]